MATPRLADFSTPRTLGRSRRALRHGVEVAMLDDRFEPNVLTVRSETTVTWVNKGADWHSVAAFGGSFESEKPATGERFSFRFDRPGDYRSICKHHGLQGMVGKVTVT